MLSDVAIRNAKVRVTIAASVNLAGMGGRRYRILPSEAFPVYDERR